MPVLFTKANIKFRLNNTIHIRRWIEAAIRKEGYKTGNIQFVFSDDAYLLSLNQYYLHHDTLTDIITFDYKEGKVVSGDIFISIERIKENAKHFSSTFSDELQRIMIHGILHLCCFRDKDKKSKAVMTAKEDFYLSSRRF